VHYVRVISPNALCAILNVCCERSEQPPIGMPSSRCLNFSNANAGQFSSPYTLEETTILAKPDPIQIGPVSGLGGNWLKLAGEMEMQLAGAPCNRVTLRLRDLEGVVKVNAYNSANVLVATAGPPPGMSAAQELVLNGAGITRLVLSSTSDKAFLQSICCERGVGP